MALRLKSARVLVLAALVAGLSGLSAAAATIQGTFSLSGAAFGGGPGLVTNTDVTSGSFNLNLSNGQSTTISLFHIFTNEPTVDADDLISRQLLAAFTATATGATDVISAAVRGFKAGTLHWGATTWGAPIVLDLGQGQQLLITLGNSVFNLGNGGLAAGSGHGADVQATFTYTIAPVPVPAAGLLLLGGFGALGALRRRKAA